MMLDGYNQICCESVSPHTVSIKVFTALARSTAMVTYDGKSWDGRGAPPSYQTKRAPILILTRTQAICPIPDLLQPNNNPLLLVVMMNVAPQSDSSSLLGSAKPLTLHRNRHVSHRSVRQWHSLTVDLYMPNTRDVIPISTLRMPS